MKNKPIIVFITNVDWFFISHRLPIAIELLSEGFQVHLIAKSTNCEMILKKYGIIFHNWRLDRSSINPLKIIYDIFKLFLIIKDIKPNIIHSITLKPIIMSGILGIIFNSSYYVYSISGLGYSYISKTVKSLIVRWITLKIFTFIFNRNNFHIIFQNKEDLNKILKISNLSSNSYSLIPGSGVYLDKFSPKSKQFNNKNKKIIFLFASRLLKSKGLIEFINSSEIFQEAEFKIAGKFDYGNEDCVSKDVIDNAVANGSIKFLGERNDMQKIINTSDVVVLPSYYGEGVPKILIEAAACGKAIITTDHPGCRDAIINNVSGILVKPRSKKELEKAIRYLLQNPDLIKNMGIEGRKLAIKKFNILDVIKKHIDIYYKILKNKNF